MINCNFYYFGKEYVKIRSLVSKEESVMNQIINNFKIILLQFKDRSIKSQSGDLLCVFL